MSKYTNYGTIKKVCDKVYDNRCIRVELKFKKMYFCVFNNHYIHICKDEKKTQLIASQVYITMRHWV